MSEDAKKKIALMKKGKIPPFNSTKGLNVETYNQVPQKGLTQRVGLRTLNEGYSFIAKEKPEDNGNNKK